MCSPSCDIDSSGSHRLPSPHDPRYSEHLGQEPARAALHGGGCGAGDRGLIFHQHRRLRGGHAAAPSLAALRVSQSPGRSYSNDRAICRTASQSGPLQQKVLVLRRATRPAVDVRAAAAVRYDRPLALVDALPAQADAVRCALVAAAPAIVVVIGEMDAFAVALDRGIGADALALLADAILRTRVAAFPTVVVWLESSRTHCFFPRLLPQHTSPSSGWQQNSPHVCLQTQLPSASSSKPVGQMHVMRSSGSLSGSSGFDALPTQTRSGGQQRWSPQLALPRLHTHLLPLHWAPAQQSAFLAHFWPSFLQSARAASRLRRPSPSASAPAASPRNVARRQLRVASHLLIRSNCCPSIRSSVRGVS